MESKETPGIQEAELDEMWSYVGKKKNQRWLWHAIDRLTGLVLAYVFGRRKDDSISEIKEAIRTVWNPTLLYRRIRSLPKTFA